MTSIVMYSQTRAMLNLGRRARGHFGKLIMKWTCTTGHKTKSETKYLSSFFVGANNTVQFERHVQ